MKQATSLVTLAVLLCSGVFGQTSPLSTRSKKALTLFEEATNYYDQKNYDRAVRVLDRALKEDQGFMEAYILKGDIFSVQGEPGNAIEQYKLGMAANSEFPSVLYYIVGNLELLTGRYEDARKDYRKYLAIPDQPRDKIDKVGNNIKSCDFGINSMAHPVPFVPINLGDSINSKYDDYMNAVTADDQQLYLTRKLPKPTRGGQESTEFNEDFFKSVKRDSVWGKAFNMGPPINTEENEGALCMSPDGKYIFFAACNRPDGYGSCDIYWSKRNGDDWSKPENLGPVVNSSTWDSQPSFASDGKTLYFASKRPGGKGSSDIWKTELQADGTWTIPVNLGDSINTKYEEMAPFIHPDNHTLYFGSRGHRGMGGFDLFVSRMDADGNWTGPVDLAYPINTYADEINLVVNAKGDLAYISSDKLGGKGGMDIYSFKLYKEAQPIMVTYFKGIVFDNETSKRLGAYFELTDLASGKIVSRSNSDLVTGEFLLSLPTDKNYALSVSKPGYLFYSDHFELKGESTKARPFIHNVPLRPIRIGESVILKNIFFDTDKYDLKSESVSELTKLVQLLKNNPTLHIEISGHTDNHGTSEHNITLSRNRAQAVYFYLINNGISKDRLSFAGYGMTKPVDTNDTEQGRANNRRTEFKVVGN